MYVIRIIARADGTPDQEAGRYLRAFDPEFLGRGFMESTSDRLRAKRFDTQAAALAFWQQETPTGRPLTAYTVSIESHREEP